MWEKVFKLRGSSDFNSMWSDFLTLSIHESACPIFFQYVVDSVFNMLINHHFQVSEEEEEDIEVMLNYAEKNTLRYTAGYVIRALVKKVKRSANPLKEQILSCLSDMMNGEELIEEPHESEDWIKMIDRGGLTHVGNMTFGVFGSMELEVKRFLNKNPSQLGAIKQELHKKISNNEDVLFYWAILSAGWEIEESDALLKLIIEHYITVRGFSFVSGWLEKYKQANKKSIQKSKGTRKLLLPSTST